MHALDAHEVDELLAVLGLGQNQDGADLCDGLGENRGRQHRPLAGLAREQPLVLRDVLDADDPAVRLELGHAIDQQERVPMRQNPLDGGVVERQRQWRGGVGHWVRRAAKSQYNRPSPAEIVRDDPTVR